MLLPSRSGLRCGPARAARAQTAWLSLVGRANARRKLRGCGNQLWGYQECCEALPASCIQPCECPATMLVGCRQRGFLQGRPTKNNPMGVRRHTPRAQAYLGWSRKKLGAKGHKIMFGQITGIAGFTNRNKVSTRHTESQSKREAPSRVRVLRTQKNKQSTKKRPAQPCLQPLVVESKKNTKRAA